MDANLNRVANTIGDIVYSFCKERVGKEFFMGDLRDFVENHYEAFAPASPDRILRWLREENKVSYTVISRSRSLYRIDGVA